MDDEHPGPVVYISRCGHDEDNCQRVTSVGPENDIVCVRIVSALEEVEENMFRLDIDISRVRSLFGIILSAVIGLCRTYETLTAQLGRKSFRPS